MIDARVGLGDGDNPRLPAIVGDPPATATEDAVAVPPWTANRRSRRYASSTVLPVVDALLARPAVAVPTVVVSKMLSVDLPPPPRTWLAGAVLALAPTEGT